MGIDHRSDRAMRMTWQAAVLALSAAAVVCAAGPAASRVTAQAAHPGVLDTDHLPEYLRDRGTGQPTSMFATYVRAGELLIYPFFEYYREKGFDYSPDRFGYADTGEYQGSFLGREELIFLCYGFTDRLAMEFEAAYMTATLDRDPNDGSGMPSHVNETGIGDVEGQIRWRWQAQDEHRPGIFSYFETVFPLQKNRKLIGTSEWEHKLGTGIIKGFRWGTVAARAAVEYSEGETALGEMALEYIRRLSSRFRVYAGMEGNGDEWEFITELQWHVRPNVFFKFNNAFGATPAATDWAPEVGVVFSFPPR